MPISPPLADTTPDSGMPNAFRLREFHELRATVRERGHVRVFVSALTFVSWAALTLGATTVPLAVFMLVPLIVLAAGFEVVYQVHVGVERVGRYLFVFYETPAGTPNWETAIAAFGRTEAAKATGGGALLVPLFILATLANLGAAWIDLARAPGIGALVIGGAIAAAHGAFIARVLAARRRAARQRDLDTAAFRTIAAELAARASPESK